MEIRMSPPVELSICICTCRRPDLLERLLAALAAQLPKNAEIVVVDNDPAHSARAVLDKWEKRLPLRSEHLPRPNIAAARNATLRLAQGEWIAFIDDDELPVDGWADILLATQRQYGADIIMAPVLPVYPEHVPVWLQQGGFFERPRFATGHAITDKDARTGNALVRASLLKGLPGPFDTDFGQSGGEDTIVFRQLFRSGASFIWCDEATVSEAVPVDRARAGWLLRRAYRFGQTSIQVELYRLPFAQAVRRGGFLGLRALIQLFVAASLSLVLLPIARLRAFHWLRITAAQLGKLSALVGARYLEYAR
jgi:succinoglycan biosynthesis protein ExoM